MSVCVRESENTKNYFFKLIGQQKRKQVKYKQMLILKGIIDFISMLIDQKKKQKN